MKPASSYRKMVLFSLSVIVLGVFFFITGRYFLLMQIQKSIQERITMLREDGIDVQYDYMKVHLWSGKLEGYQLTVKLGEDSLNPGLQGHIPYFLVKGIKVLPFIRSKKLVIEQVKLAQASIRYAWLSTVLKKDTTKNQGVALQHIEIDNVELPQLNIVLQDSLQQDSLVHLSAHIQLQNLEMEHRDDSLTLRKANLSITDAEFELPEEFYSGTVKKIQLNVADKTFNVDSLRFKPVYSRQQYMKKLGKQIDYLDAVVPYIKVSGVEWNSYPATSIDIGRIGLQMFLKIYRDKRYPFRKKKQTVLPVHYLHQLPMTVKIDTIKLHNSYVSYEEHPEKGDSSGRVFFDRLQATISTVHNLKDWRENMTMEAHAKFMGAGDLHVRGIFPYNTAMAYRITGSLKEFPLTHLNGMLGPAVSARIESGNMTNLKFHFVYNMLRSDGEVELNYENLKITSLKENKKNEQAVSLLKTLLLNTFIVKKDMNGEVEKDKRTGVILFYRDTKRSIFNYWWKSLLSGLKFAYRLDKPPAKDNSTSRKKDKDRTKQKMREPV